MTPTLAHISDYLLKAELHEGDCWHRQDYRIASVMVWQAEQGECPSYELAFLQLFGRHPKRVTSWWRNRRILARLAEFCNTPTPLLAANRLNEALTVIPDYDPTTKYIPRPGRVA